MNGAIKIKSININFYSNGEKVIKPKKRINLEYIGNSITYTYDIESKS